jgi:hypothetical protein
MSLLERVVPDEIRGVGPFHSRVYPGSQSELDRLHQEEGVRAPWMPNQEDEEREERLAVQIIRGFLHSLVHMTKRERDIFFARLKGLEWQEIADAIIGDDCTAQAAQNEFRKTLERFPDLNRAFQERQPNRTKEHEA